MVTQTRTLLAALAVLGTAGAPSAAEPSPARGAAQSCHVPDALGVSRTVEVGGPVQAGGPVELGLKTYPRTLDLRDHEVVLTFDDGPWGPTTPDVLRALDAQCVKATFFLIGRNAQARPDLVKREVAAGHTVGHHTWDHPALTLHYLSAERGVDEIERGMRADEAAAGDGPWTGRPRVPFFRYPGFGDSPDTLRWLHERGVAVFGADLWASDWIPMTPDAEFDLLMGRLRAAGRGIVLLHDIKRQTADMLPRFLAALKAEGFHVVHVVPGGAATPTRAAPAGWTSETERTVAHMWPKAPPAASSMLAMPSAARAEVRPARSAAVPAVSPAALPAPLPAAPLATPPGSAPLKPGLD